MTRCIRGLPARFLPAVAVWLGLGLLCCGPAREADEADRRSEARSGETGDDREHLPLTFGILGAFPSPDSGGAIPDEIRDLNGRRIMIEGYQVPVDMESEGTNRFVLLKCTLACCYGKIPRVNEWIDVSMAGEKRVRFYSDRPIWVYGRLEVQEEVENGQMVALYGMKAEKIVGPRDR